MAHIITITGPSLCGKSTVIKQLEILSASEKYKDKFKVVKVPKYTTRPFRQNEIYSINSGNLNDLDVLPVIGKYNECDNATEEELKLLRFSSFNKLGCDLIYEQYGHRDGIRLSDLYNHIRLGESPVVILNDVRAIEDIKKIIRQGVCCMREDSLRICTILKIMKKSINSAEINTVLL